MQNKKYPHWGYDVLADKTEEDINLNLESILSIQDPHERREATFKYFGTNSMISIMHEFSRAILAVLKDLDIADTSEWTTSFRSNSTLVMSPNIEERAIRLTPFICQSTYSTFDFIECLVEEKGKIHGIVVFSVLKTEIDFENLGTYALLLKPWIKHWDGIELKRKKLEELEEKQRQERRQLLLQLGADPDEADIKIFI